jgi:hypothetical protein
VKWPFRKRSSTGSGRTQILSQTMFLNSKLCACVSDGQPHAARGHGLDGVLRPPTQRCEVRGRRLRLWRASWYEFESIIHIYSHPVELAPMFPDKRMLGLEIRIKVSDYVRDRIHALRLCVFACTALTSQAESGDVRQRRGAPCERHEVFAELLPQRTGAFTCVALTAARKDVLPVPRPTLQGQKAQVAHHQVWCVFDAYASPTLLAEYAFVLGEGVRPTGSCPCFDAPRAVYLIHRCHFCLCP